MKQEIEVGDLVIVRFSSHPDIEGIVRYTPQATGDSWRITTGDAADDVVYVQQFDYMLLLAKGG